MMTTQLTHFPAEAAENLRELVGLAPPHRPAGPVRALTTVLPRAPVASGGEPGWDDLDPCVVRVVRRALLQESDALPVTRRVHAAARRLAGPNWRDQPGDHENLIRRVAQVLGEGLGGGTWR
jgi:hypothetical protein